MDRLPVRTLRELEGMKGQVLNIVTSKSAEPLYAKVSDTPASGTHPLVLNIALVSPLEYRPKSS